MKEIIPVVTWDAVPGCVFIVHPKSTEWLVARDTATRGTIVDVMQPASSEKYLKVSAAHGVIEVLYGKNGTTVVYH